MSQDMQSACIHSHFLCTALFHTNIISSCKEGESNRLIHCRRAVIRNFEECLGSRLLILNSAWFCCKASQIDEIGHRPDFAQCRR